MQCNANANVNADAEIPMARFSNGYCLRFWGVTLTYKWFQDIVKTAIFDCLIKKPYFAAFSISTMKQRKFSTMKVSCHKVKGIYSLYYCAKACFKTWFS